MHIVGLLKTTLLDYPGCVAATIFLSGCNMRCPFCHNMNLVTYDGSSTEIYEYSISEVMEFLKKRRGVLDGVCITGGEPTINPDLDDLIREIKSFGYKVKLDTNGTNPQMLLSLIDRKLIDYVAMDVKASLDKYSLVSGVTDIDIKNITKSIDILINSNIESEFRTTLISDFHTKEDIISIGKLIKGAKRYYLQSFKDAEYVPNHELREVDDSDIIEFKEILEEYVNIVEIRGRDIN